MGIFWAVIIVAGIGLFFGAGLAIASMVMESPPCDQRIDEITGVLSGTNCGGCGFAGCEAYAIAVVSDGAKCNLCHPGGEETAAAISAIMGVEAVPAEKLAAQICCCGTAENCPDIYAYAGEQTCAAAAMLYSGSKACDFGCLGLGDCIRACPFGAIAFENGIASVRESPCRACKVCVKSCPKGLIKIVNVDETTPKAAVLCGNTDPGGVCRKQCKVSCIGCRACQKACVAGAIRMKDNLAVIDQEKCDGCGKCALICPRKCIELK